jgi:hypothetical protein
MAFNIHKPASPIRPRPLGCGSGSLSFRRVARNLELDLSQVFSEVALPTNPSPKLRRGSNSCEVRPERIPMCFSDQAATIELRLPLDVPHQDYAIPYAPSRFDGTSRNGFNTDYEPSFGLVNPNSSMAHSSLFMSYESDDSGFCEEDSDMDSDMECGDCDGEYDEKSDVSVDMADAFDFDGLSARLRNIRLEEGVPAGRLVANGMTLEEVMCLVQRLQGYSLVGPDRMETGC